MAGHPEHCDATHTSRAPSATKGHWTLRVMPIAALLVTVQPGHDVTGLHAHHVPPASHRAAAPCIASAPASLDGNADEEARSARYREALARCMSEMHGAMDAALAAPGQGVERLFVASMIPHHQGAVDMARQLLVHSRDAELRAFALNVIAEQQVEIQQLRAWAAHHANAPRSSAATPSHATTPAHVPRMRP